MKINRIDFSSKVSDRLGFIIIMIAGLVIATVTIKIGQKLIDDAPNSKAFSDSRQTQKLLDSTK